MSIQVLKGVVSMNRRKLLIGGLIVLFALAFAAGCPARDGADPPPPPGGNGGDGDGVDVDINALVGQWVESDHSNILLSPAQRDGCVLCHDGGAFSEGITEIASVERDFFVSIDCRACHAGEGAALMESGTVDIPTADGVQGGTGAQCMACHNERYAPIFENLRAPHNSSQAGLFTASGGAQVGGFDYGSTAPHRNVENSCVGCHMTQTEEGFASHSFRVDDVQAACGQCHQNLTDANLEAQNDYDGDGETKGFQDEVDGLIALVEEAVSEALDGATFSSGQGAIQFVDANEEPVTDVPEEVYNAAFNVMLLRNDGSQGIHNPIYAVQLLQQSYREVTGEDVPGATIR
jgi:hypothetical protein